MLTRTTLLCSLLLLAACMGCGTNVEEQRAMEMRAAARVDSIKQATRAEVQREEAMRKAYADTLTGLKGEVMMLQAQVVASKAELVAAEDKLNRVSQFQLGRARWEREQQIKEAAAQVESLRMHIPELEAALAEAQGRANELASSGLAGKR